MANPLSKEQLKKENDVLRRTLNMTLHTLDMYEEIAAIYDDDSWLGFVRGLKKSILSALDNVSYREKIH